MTPIRLSKPDITQREIDAVIEVLHGPTLTAGPKLQEFEAKCATIAGRRHGVGVSSGTAALHCALLAAGVGPGSRVITTPFAVLPLANSILYTGAVPKFVDIDPRTLNLDLKQVEAAITPDTKAVVAVEAFGNPRGMIELEQLANQRGVTLIEDGCQGLGGKFSGRAIGSFGTAGVFSFHPGKQITTGEGGMIVTDDDRFAHTCRALRNHGHGADDGPGGSSLGFNYRMGEINAAIGCVQAERLDELLDARRRVAHAYMNRLLANRYLVLPTIDEQTQMSWYAFVVRLSDLFAAADRDTIMLQLRSEGIGCGTHVQAIHLAPHLSAASGQKPGDLPVTEYVASRTLALPFFGGMLPRQIADVCDALERALERTLTGGKGRF